MVENTLKRLVFDIVKSVEMKTTEEILNENMLIIHAFSPRIGKALELFWGDRDFPPYINKLLADDFPGGKQRQGFPIDVLGALIKLQDLHDKVYPNLAIDNPDDWLSSQFGVF